MSATSQTQSQTRTRTKNKRHNRHHRGNRKKLKQESDLHILQRLHLQFWQPHDPNEVWDNGAFGNEVLWVHSYIGDHYRKDMEDNSQNEKEHAREWCIDMCDIYGECENNCFHSRSPSFLVVRIARTKLINDQCPIEQRFSNFFRTLFRRNNWIQISFIVLPSNFHYLQMLCDSSTRRHYEKPPPTKQGYSVFPHRLWKLDLMLSICSWDGQLNSCSNWSYVLIPLFLLLDVLSQNTGFRFWFYWLWIRCHKCHILEQRFPLCESTVRWNNVIFELDAGYVLLLCQEWIIIHFETVTTIYDTESWSDILDEHNSLSRSNFFVWPWVTACFCWSLANQFKVTRVRPVCHQSLWFWKVLISHRVSPVQCTAICNVPLTPAGGNTKNLFVVVG